VVIVSLGSWVYSEYVNNAYFQSYVNSLAPVLVPIVSVGFGITSATIATLLYFTMRNVRQREGLESGDADRTRSQMKETVQKRRPATTRTSRPETSHLATGPRSRFLAATSTSSRREAVPRTSSEEDEDESD
jgi:hypothetical protein